MILLYLLYLTFYPRVIWLCLSLLISLSYFCFSDALCLHSPPMSDSNCLWLLFMRLLGAQIKKLSQSISPTAASFPCPLQSHYVSVFSSRSLSISLLWCCVVSMTIKQHVQRKRSDYSVSFICCRVNLYCSHSINRKIEERKQFPQKIQ